MAQTHQPVNLLEVLCKYLTYVNIINQYRQDTNRARKFDWPLFLAELETKENEMLEIHVKNCSLEIVTQ